MQLFKNKIPTSEMTEKTADKIKTGNKHRKESIEFINTESNKDNYICEVLLRKLHGEYRIKLTHYTGILDYAAFERIWTFGKEEHSLSDNIFDTIVYILEGIRENYNRSMMPAGMITQMINESTRFIAESHQSKTNIPLVNESNRNAHATDWRESIYGHKYPLLRQNKIDPTFPINQPDPPSKRIQYKKRGE